MNHKKTKVLIVYSEFNRVITTSLLNGAKKYFLEQGIADKNITIIQVPGAIEIPIALKKEINRKIGTSYIFDAAVAIGAVVRGSTPHFDYVCNQVSQGIQQVMLETSMPISFGILTTDNFEQAIKRCAHDSSNKGREAAEAALKTLEVLS